MTFLKISGCALAIVAVLSAPAAARPQVVDEAEAIRKLDIMLMVTALRCRTGTDNFQSDYARFAATHLKALNAASRTLQADLVARNGQTGARRALDRISVGMANDYGQGHPWLGCGELKQITRSLASDRDSAKLVDAADELLSAAPRPQWAMAGGS